MSNKKPQQPNYYGEHDLSNPSRNQSPPELNIGGNKPERKSGLKIGRPVITPFGTHGRIVKIQSEVDPRDRENKNPKSYKALVEHTHNGSTKQEWFHVHQLQPHMKKSEEGDKEEFLSKPYSSEAQRRWAHTQAGKEALGGESAVHEWDEATKGKHIPEKVGKSEDPSTSQANDEDAAPLMNRIEDKYFVHKNHLDQLVMTLKDKLPEGDIDTESRYNLNQTIYLDTDDLDSFRAGMRDKKPRFKVRIRRYAPNCTKWEDVAYAELKIKADSGMSKKIRIRFPANDIRRIAAGGKFEENDLLKELNKDIEEKELSRRIDNYNKIVEKFDLKRRMVVVYERRAFSGENIRITVDDRLKCSSLGKIPEDIKEDLQKGKYKKFVKPLRKFNDNDYLIVEVKHTNGIPSWVSELLEKIEAKKVKFSKYCASVYSSIFPHSEVKKPISLVDFGVEREKAGDYNFSSMNKSEEGFESLAKSEVLEIKKTDKDIHEIISSEPLLKSSHSKALLLTGELLKNYLEDNKDLKEQIETILNKGK